MEPGFKRGAFLYSRGAPVSSGFPIVVIDGIQQRSRIPVVLPVPSFPLATQGPTIGYTKIEESATSIPYSQPTQAANKSRLNSYERSLLEKAALRKSFLKKWIEEQEQLSHLSFNDTKYVIYTPIGYGLGNCLSILSEAIMLSWITHRRFLSRIVVYKQCSLPLPVLFLLLFASPSGLHDRPFKSEPSPNETQTRRSAPPLRRRLPAAAT